MAAPAPALAQPENFPIKSHLVRSGTRRRFPAGLIRREDKDLVEFNLKHPNPGTSHGEKLNKHELDVYCFELHGGVHIYARVYNPHGSHRMVVNHG